MKTGQAMEQVLRERSLCRERRTDSLFLYLPLSPLANAAVSKADAAASKVSTSLFLYLPLSLHADTAIGKSGAAVSRAGTSLFLNLPTPPLAKLTLSLAKPAVAYSSKVGWRCFGLAVCDGVNRRQSAGVTWPAEQGRGRGQGLRREL